MKTKFITLLIAIVLLSSMAMAATITRTAQSTVSPSSTFTLTYTASGVSGTWGGIIVDNVAGGCQFPVGTQYKDAMLSMSGTVKTIQVTAPSSGSCTFTGYYNFAEEDKTNFPVLTVTINGNGNGDEDSNMIWIVVGIFGAILLLMLIRRK